MIGIESRWQRFDTIARQKTSVKVAFGKRQPRPLKDEDRLRLPGPWAATPLICRVNALERTTTEERDKRLFTVCN